MIAIEVQTVFCAAHAIRLGDDTEILHGHNFQVAVRLSCQRLDNAQTVADFHEVEELLRQVLAPWENQNLNMLEPFRGRVNPSAERIAELIGTQLQGRLGELADDAVVGRGVRVSEVRVSEAPGCMAIWMP